MKVVLFQIGSFSVYGYGLMMALGIVAAFALALIRSKYFYKIDPDIFFNGGIIGLVFGLLGAKVTYWLVEIKSVIANPRMLLDIGGGFVVYGGVILGILIPIIYLKKIRKTTVLDKLDLAMPSISIGQAIGRVGCLLAGCCYGRPVPEGAWYGITFPAGAEAPAGVALYPTQIISAVGNLLLCVFLVLYTNKERVRGEVVTLYMILYSVGRFLVEFLRNDPRGNVGALSTSQFISIFVFAAGIGLWIFLKHKNLSPLRRAGRFVSAEEQKKADQKEKEAGEDSGKQE